MDAVQKANSGHPGMPMGAAAMAHALWTRHLKHNPADPKWFDRDRFVLSAGHGSMLLYALLFLTGYELTLEDLKQFRQWGSATPGHPENHLTPGVEMATGPLGQGISTAVGMALSERFLAAAYNRPGHDVIDHRTYVIASDGDLMEGVSNEACSFAGHQRLGKLIVLYDDNKITIDGSTDLSFTEDVEGRYRALGWGVWRCDGMDVDAVDGCLQAARTDTDRPSLIICRTTIGFGSPHKAGKSSSHGAALGVEEVFLSKEALGIPEEDFWVDPDALRFYRTALEKGKAAQSAWSDSLDQYAGAFPTQAEELRRLMNGDFGRDWVSQLPSFEEAGATRDQSNAVINAIAEKLPTLVGGCADLAESVKTHIKSSTTCDPSNPAGRNVNYGVREHAMAAIVNGMTLHGGTRAYGGTFLIFSDYCRPSLRLSALMQCPSIMAFSHDSIGLGEDGPTHQPVEHLMSLRAIPNFNVFRPADGNETAVAWKIALESASTPTAIVLSRQKLPILSGGMVTKHPAERGAYVVREASGGQPSMILVASGSELELAVKGGEELEKQGIATRVVSMPSWFLFEQQAETYRASTLPKAIPTVSIEAGTTLGWDRYAQAHVGLDHFGASAPANVLFKEFGFTVENVVATALALLGKE
ncbi:MAG: transketolase [Armatimonadetes bacterium]|nr:transketolase [Armatimonadota bacterium]